MTPPASEEIAASRRTVIAAYLHHRAYQSWAFTEKHFIRLRDALPHAEVIWCVEEGEFLGVLERVNVALVWSFNEEWLELAPRLSWLATPAAGREHLRIRPTSNLRVDYGSYHGELMGETVLGMMLAQTRGILLASQLQANDPWPRADMDRAMRPLRGSHVVILGFGHIGEWIARLAKPFGVRISGVRRTVGRTPSFLGDDDRIVSMAELDAILPSADHLVLSLPGGESTTHMMDAKRLSLLPTTACIYNVGRGNAIDETALAAMLREGRLAGACLDVFETEPLPEDAAIRGCPNTLLMPHSSAMSPTYIDLFVEEFIKRFRSQG